MVGLRTGLRVAPRVGLAVGVASDELSAGASRGTVVATNLETSSSTVNGTSFATGSVSPSANALILVGAMQTSTAATATVTGNGITYDLVAEATVGVRRLSVFRGMSASPSAGAITIDYGAVTQNSCLWSVVQLTGVDTSGLNGAGAVVQSDTSTDNTGTATTINATLPGALEDATNAMVAFVGLSIQSTVTPDAQFAEIGDDNETANVGTIESQWAVNQTTCAPTFAASNAVIVALEVKSSE